MRVVRLERNLVAGILAALAALLASVSVLLFAFRPAPDVVVPSPAHRADWNDYDDRDAGGTSRCDVLSSIPLRIATFSSAAPGAYWGIEWGPAASGSAERFWKWQAGDSLVIRWRARKARHLQIHLCGHDPDLTRPGEPLSRRYLSASLPIGEEWTTTAIALGDFAPPEWWRALHPDLQGDPHAFLERTLDLQVAPAPGAASLGDDTIEIASIARIPSRSHAWMVVLACALLAGIGAWALGRKRTPSPEDTPLELVPRSLDAPAPDLQRLLEHLRSNYQRDDLDLATVARECGLSPRRVSTLLANRGESFKSALNRLRLDEARRLLGVTDLQISEIGFKVGYRNVSHFHRMFRERFGAAPGTFRDLRNPHEDLRNPQVAEKASDETGSG